jgi:hypothetical protein
MARIFTPIRGQLSTLREMAAATLPSLGDPAEANWAWSNRMGTQPVTNTSPSGPPTPAAQPARSTKEEGWLALLEMVFEATGWPGAD